jgi:hypothetical protein
MIFHGAQHHSSSGIVEHLGEGGMGVVCGFSLGIYH